MIQGALLGLLLLSPQSDAAAVVKGSVTLKGDAPEPRKFKAHDDKSQKAFPDGALYEPVPLDGDKHIRWALVYVKSGGEGARVDAPKEPKALDLEGFQLKPRMLGIRVGQELLVTNHDGAFHAVHALPRLPGNREFNTGLPRKGESLKAVFARPEVAIRIKSEDLHEWEQAWVAVLPHPFFCVTDDQGKYEIKGLPAGKYTLEAWQENCEPAAREIELGAREGRTVDFLLEARLRAHLFITGRVQGVGFRASTEEEARRIGGLVGWVRNLDDGRVEAVIQGPADKVEKLVQWCHKGPSSAEVKRVERKDEAAADEFKGFEIRS